MASSSTSVFLLHLSCILLIFVFAMGRDESVSKCHESFECGSAGNMSFPFTKQNETLYCGSGRLARVDCNERIHARIQVWPEGNWLDLLKPIYSNTTETRAPWLEEEGCPLFSHSLYFQPSPQITFSYFPNITLFKCLTDPDDHTVARRFAGYDNFTSCKKEGFYVYYNYTAYAEADAEAVTPSSIPNGCTVIRRPAVHFDPELDRKNLYSLLASNFSLSWYVSEECHDCHRIGHQCQYDWQGNSSSCTKPIASQGKNNLVKIIAPVCAGVAFLIICLAVFVFWRRRKTSIKTSYILSHSTSFDPSSKSDHELGSVYPGVPVFTYAELEEATNNFDASKELGDGGFGIVYYGRLRDGRAVAVKRLYEHNYKRVEQFMNEIKILTCLKHPNLVQLYGCTSRRSRELLLVYEYVSNGTVADHLHGERERARQLDWPTRMKIAIETASALTYLHAKDIIHRDVKTNNILLDQNFSVKVADFGLSRLFPNDVTHVSTAPQGTPGYVDPEYHECYQLTSKSDVYSFGVVLVELISSLPAVDISRHRYEINLANLAINRIQRHAFDELIDPSLGYQTDPEVKRMTLSIAELAFRCLQVDKEFRPTMDEVLESLQEIEKGKEFKFEMERTNEHFQVYKSVRTPPSPKSEDSRLLKTMKPPSPISVTDVWISGSSTVSG